MTDREPEADRPADAPSRAAGTRRLVGGILVAAGVLTVAATVMFRGDGEVQQAAGTGQPELSANAPKPDAADAPGPPASDAGPEEAASTMVAGEEVARTDVASDDAAGVAAAGPEAPAFDLVRVERDGSAVIAGTAAPGARVTIRSDAAPLAEAEADADGNFVAIFRAEPGADPQALTLDAEAPDGTQSRSDAVVMLLPEAPADGTEPGPDTAVGSTEEQPAVAATAVVRADGEVEVTPTRAPGVEAGGARQVTLASIAYSDAGDVSLSGLGTPGAGLRVYVDGRLAREGAVSGDGRWALEIDDLAEGLYRLRIDALDAENRVESRVETPFQRDFPTAPRPRPGGAATVADLVDGQITVQPGNTLWTLARVHYGTGVLFTQIFTANTDLIRDPDLIYPGQVLALPGAEEAD